MSPSGYDPVHFPELFFGIAGPIGIDVDGMADAIAAGLVELDYASSMIKLTKEMQRFGSGTLPVTKSKHDDYTAKMNYANDLRKTFGSQALSAIAISSITIERAAINQRMNRTVVDVKVPAKRPVEKHAFIIRQFKHPSEIEMMRHVYGQRFILISGYASHEQRFKKLCDDIRRTESTQLKASEISSKALSLMERDASETDDSLGQQLRDTFHLADLFVDGIKTDRMKAEINRFLEACFGRADLSPRKFEYGMYAAKSASLRSVDLARQVGAAIFSTEGELITQGCNKVPKALGGTYWEGEEPDNRDVKKGFDPNDQIKKEVLRDVIERLRKAQFLAPVLLEYGDDQSIVDALTKKGRKGSQEPTGALASSSIMDATEYGRVVHAEMCAVCDAARLGRSLKGSILYCTTFPCHNCTKHIIACGITKVIYLEPYPKSKAAELHPDEIELEVETKSGKVSFVPFLGISPLRYRNIFQKGRRKDDNGRARKWIDGSPRPVFDLEYGDYTLSSEEIAQKVLFEQRKS